MRHFRQLFVAGALLVCGAAFAAPADAQYYGYPPYGAYGHGYARSPYAPPYADYGFYDGGYRFLNDLGYYDGGYFSDFGYYDNWYTDATRYGFRGFGPRFYGNYYTPNWYDWGW